MSAIERWVTKDLEDLEPNWNGYGEQEIDDRAIAALDLISIVPLASGGIQLEWHTHTFDIEVEIRPAGTLGCVMAEIVEEQP